MDKLLKKNKVKLPLKDLCVYEQALRIFDKEIKIRADKKGKLSSSDRTTLDQALSVIHEEVERVLSSRLSKVDKSSYGET